MPYLSSTDSQPLDCHTKTSHNFFKITLILLKQYMEVYGILTQELQMQCSNTFTQVGRLYHVTK